MNYLENAQAILPELRTLRETFHSNPELGKKEYRTADLIESKLIEWGISVVRPLPTAIIGTLKGALPGKTVALRADMDALPVFEETGASFSSHNVGVMHACGHDVHMSALLGAAKMLSEQKEQLKGTVLFIFEPDEEGAGGAEKMVQAGCLDGVDAVFGAHVDPALPLGSVGIRYGKFYAASDVFTVTVHGKGAHGATPELGIDALHIASQMICALNQLTLDSDERYVLSVGTMDAGTALNIIAETAKFSGIIRTLGPVNREEMKRKMQETVRDIAAANGATAEVALRESYGGIINTDAETALVEKTAAAVLGSGNVQVIDQPTMTTEDFGYYVDACSGSFFHIGAGCSYPLHNAHFLPQDDAIAVGAAMHASIVENFLNG